MHEKYKIEESKIYDNYYDSHGELHVDEIIFTDAISKAKKLREYRKKKLINLYSE